MRTKTGAARPLIAALCALIAMLLVAAPASATTVNPSGYNGTWPGGSFDGHDAVGPPSPPGFTSIQKLDVNQVTEDVLVAANGWIYQFNSAGVSQPFSALTPNTAFKMYMDQWGGLKIDNSPTSTQGRFYALSEGISVNAYLSSGAALTGTSFPLSGIGNTCGAAVAANGDLWISTHEYEKSTVHEYTPSGVATGNVVHIDGEVCDFAIDSQGNFYAPELVFPRSGGPVSKYSPTGVPEGQIDEGPSVAVAVDLSNDDVYVDDGSHVDHYTSAGALLGSFGTSEPSHSYPGLSHSTGIAVNKNTHTVYAANSNRVDTFVPTGAITIPTVTTTAAGDVTATSATLHGVVNGDGIDTTDCHFEWGETIAYGNSTPCAEGNVFSGGSGDHNVTAAISGLTKGAVYYFRLTAKNANNYVSYGARLTFKAAAKPVLSNVGVTRVNTDGAQLNAEIDPNGDRTSYHFEWGADTSYGNVVPVPDGRLASSVTAQSVSQALDGQLSPGTRYHFRVVASNAFGTTISDDHTFMTFPLNPATADPCPNAQVRQQTGASLLMDCRAYELVSAANAGGYDVQSDLIPGQAPLSAYPQAGDRVLYSLHNGTIPGIAGNPTNLGLDPYIASRGANGWSTAYVGIPANGTPSTSSFGSPLLGAGQGLSTFAFGNNGSEPICSPCFADGSTGIPVRMPDGSLVQGMKGSLNPSGATRDGYVGKPLSADGSHLVFSSTSKFEPDGNSNGDVSIYDRNLETGLTQVVSKAPAGTNLACLQGAGSCHSPGDPNGIAELDISSDGSRIVVGQLVSTDADGNRYYHLYMHVGYAPAYTIDLTPGATHGVLYDGMTADGTKVFFTTRDALATATNQDTDTSADVYMADVSNPSGPAVLSRISTGSGAPAGNTDACAPTANWNTVSGGPNCDAVALAGGAGVASGDGTIYFLSPEKLDGASHGVQDQPNLYIARPGSAPHFVATLGVNDTAVVHAVRQAGTHDNSDFQVSPSGDYAVFASRLSPTGYNNLGHSEIYRYDALTDTPDCVSCAPTNAAGTADSTLSSSGLNLSDDGRVFFTSPEALVLRDTNGKTDAYEWRDGSVQLISTGASPLDSGLLSVSSDGTNVYFFTRETLVPEDENGDTMKIYDAREGGGFLSLPPGHPCAASDECHGPGTPAALPLEINTYTGSGAPTVTPPIPKPCRRGFVRTHGKCVRRHPKKRHTTHRHG